MSIEALLAFMTGWSGAPAVAAESTRLACKEAAISVSFFDGTSALEKDVFCFSESTRELRSRSCDRGPKGPCQAIQAALKGTAQRLRGGIYGTPGSYACHEAGGRPQVIKLLWEGRAYALDRCTVAGSFVDLDTFFRISRNPIQYRVDNGL